jgi:hypothetical protein
MTVSPDPAPAAIRLKLEFNRAADKAAVTEYYALDAATFRRLQLRQARQQNGSTGAESVSDWLRASSGQLDRADCPAVIATRPDGYRYEALPLIYEIFRVAGLW